MTASQNQLQPRRHKSKLKFGCLCEERDNGESSACDIALRLELKSYRKYHDHQKDILLTMGDDVDDKNTSNDTAPITLHTDASDYGVGGYLFQTVDGIDQPVAFVSKSLNKSQLRWSVIQKESYGIFFS